MLFNSYIFIFAFLPIALLGYFICNKFGKYQLANIFLIGMSLWFYGYFNITYLPIICGSILINYFFSRMLSNSAIKRKYRTILMAVGVVINIAVIFYFKYFDFFLENLNTIFNRSFEFKNIVLPLGISFFTFQQVSYLVDSYRTQETRDYGFIEYTLFVLFFPQLIAGPIVLHKEMIPQFRNEHNRIFNSENFARGMYIFAIGLFKKVLIADTFSKAVAIGYNNVENLSSLEALLVSFSYTFQIYFDFSGYCDMAIGISSMFNINLPQNFNSPYKATSIIDFWNRWHMSLTRFLREYVYFPLGGSRKGKVRTYVNVMIVFLVSGIWHGANWTFIVWGIMHGVAQCLNRMFKNIWVKLGVVTQWFMTFMFVNAAWVVFRANDLEQAILFLKRMVLLDSFDIRRELWAQYEWIEIKYLAEHVIHPLGYIEGIIDGLYMWILLFVSFFVVLNLKNSNEIKFRPTLGRSLATIVMVVWSVMSFAGVSEFLYFNF